MTTQHTPGPWSVRGNVLLNARGESIASAGNNRAVLGEELGASLRLAAAAPRLLEALQKAVRFGGLFPDLKAEAEAAINEATGEPQ